MRHREQRQRRLRRGIFLLPSLLTVGNVMAGYGSLILADQGDFAKAAMLLMLAAGLDNLDGRVARATGTATEFGLQFDSIADIISFGVAPSFIVYRWGLLSLGRVGWAASFLFLICGAMRLARFNTQAVSDKRYFVGLPVPAAAMVLATLIAYIPRPAGDSIFPVAVLCLVLTLSGLMVSRLRYRSFKRVEATAARRTFPVVGIIAVVLAAVVIQPQATLLGLSLLYMISGLLPRRRATRGVPWRRAGSPRAAGPGPALDSEGRPRER
ncbi:MAG: CDP-diacylglycerol--serine O-phosphatidyltransferase [Acidobacteriota bacterium]